MAATPQWFWAFSTLAHIRGCISHLCKPFQSVILWRRVQTSITDGGVFFLMCNRTILTAAEKPWSLRTAIKIATMFCAMV
jgi:hypothetical protein